MPPRLMTLMMATAPTMIGIMTTSDKATHVLDCNVAHVVLALAVQVVSGVTEPIRLTITTIPMNTDTRIPTRIPMMLWAPPLALMLYSPKKVYTKH